MELPSADASSAEGSLEQRYEQHGRVVYQHLVLIGLDRPAAEDVLQETFLRLHSEMAKGRQIQSPRWWLLKVSTNLGLNYLRDSRARGEIQGAPAAEILGRSVATGSSAEQLVLNAERDLNLIRAMDQLSPQQRVCLHLRAEGMRYREIAEALNVSVSTVEEFLGRAITRLQRNLR